LGSFALILVCPAPAQEKWDWFGAGSCRGIGGFGRPAPGVKYLLDDS
jgi:hypothetical protein